MTRLLAFGVAALVALPASGGPLDSGKVLHRKVTAADGTALALYRFQPDGGGLAQPPVLLVPELGLGREAWDLDGDGLARYLQARGRDVFVAELRGQGRSAAPPGWRLAELVSQDLPAVLAAIATLRSGPVDLVVHGYSGGLALAACAEELKGRVRRVVALSPAVLPEVPNAATAKLLRGGGALGAFARDPASNKDFELLFTRGGQLDGGRVSALRGAMSDLSRAAAADLLAWMEGGDLPLGPRGTVRERLARYDRPTLVLLAMQDNFAHPEFGSPLRDLAPADVKVTLLTRVNLLTEDYTHLSLLQGNQAQVEIFSPVLRFLNAPGPKPPPGTQRAEEGVR